MAQLITKVIRCMTIPTSSVKRPISRFISTTWSLKTQERLYTKNHEWVSINGNIGKVGISNYAQDALGDIVFVQLPDVGSTVKKEEECGALESVKAASEIISPLTGKVVEKNDAAENKPGLINSACYTDGWLYKLEIADSNEVKSLMNEKTYEDYLKTDPH